MSLRIFGRTMGSAALLCSVFAGTPVLAASTAELPLPDGCELVASRAGTEPAVKALEPAFPPVPLQIRTPVEPTVFASGGRNYLVYELHLQNFANDPLTLRGIEVINADSPVEKSIAVFKETHLNALLRPEGNDDNDDNRRLGARQGVVAFLCLAFNGNAAVPGKLRHRVLLHDSIAVGPVIQNRRTALPVFGRPLVGTDWVPANGPHVGSHHRMGMWLTDGVAQISRRYGIDWRKVKGGSRFSGDARDLRSYYAYGEKVLSVADGTVVVARDGFPDNVPKTEAGFEPAVPVTTQTIVGNNVVIDVGGGQLASYAHLQPGSVRVKPGDRVKRGQLLGRVGNSGDSRWPHLHFQVAANAHILDSEGLPFLVDQFRTKVGDQGWVTRTREFPWGETVVIDFGPDTAEAQK